MTADGYSSHADYMSWVSKGAQKRQQEIEKALREAFKSFIEVRSVETIVFTNLSATDLANAITTHPSVLKPLCVACNVAARAIERDLQIKNLDTYDPKVTPQEAATIAGYIKPYLPPYLEIPTLTHLDRVEYIDKEIRKGKGQWERNILDELNRQGSVSFKKRHFEVGGEEFELDAAHPIKGPIKIGIDIKRIEARRDIHKRCDEIVNKAAKLKSVYRQARFGAVIYYPFVDEHINIQNRLKSDNIDATAFASSASDNIENAIRSLLKQLKVAQ